MAHKNWLSRLTKRTRKNQKRRTSRKSLRFESLEDRQLMTASPWMALSGETLQLQGTDQPDAAIVALEVDSLRTIVRTIGSDPVYSFQ